MWIPHVSGSREKEEEEEKKGHLGHFTRTGALVPMWTGQMVCHTNKSGKNV
jgi:hypothetical protein